MQKDEVRKRIWIFCFCHICGKPITFPLYKALVLWETAVFSIMMPIIPQHFTYVSLRTILYLYQGKVLTRAYIQAGTTENWIDTEAI